MSTTIRKMHTQLKTWREKIDRLAARDARSGAQADSSSAQRIEELKALYAAALKEFTGFRTADAEGRASLKPRTVSAWNALAAACRSPKPIV